MATKTRIRPRSQTTTRYQHQRRLRRLAAARCARYQFRLPVAVRSIGHVPRFITRLIGSTVSAVSLYLTRLYIHYRVQVDDRAKCPACGRRDRHRVYWDPTYEHVMHEHQRRAGGRGSREIGCGAIWGEPPVANIARWRVEVGPPVQPETGTGLGPPQLGKESRPTRPLAAAGPTGRPVPMSEGHTTTVVSQVN